MEPERQLRPLLVAAGIALAVLALLAFTSVDLYQCTFADEARSQRTVSGVVGDIRLDRSLRLWLDAGDLAGDLERALGDELTRRGAHVALKQQSTGDGQVTVRVDDGSLYTPLYARAKLTAAMRFEARAAHDAALAHAQGDTHVEVTGTCYGVIAPASFRADLARHLANPLATALGAAFD